MASNRHQPMTEVQDSIGRRLYGLPTSYPGECHYIVSPYREADAHQQ
jgi:hypothetical protein